jgi:chromosome segregation ATPase
MGKAQKVQDLLSLESELARVRGEIERATGRLRFLKARTDLATIQVALVRAPLVAPPDGLFGRVVEQVKQALADGWSTAFAVALGAAVLAAQLSPLALFALAGWLIYRRWTSRRAQAATLL